MHVQGVPVGDRAFVGAEVGRLVLRAEKKVRLVRDVLACTEYRHHLHTANVYCFAPLLDYLLRCCFPDDVRQPLVRFDSVLKSTAQLALGLQLDDPLVLERSWLPPRRGGLLLRQRGGPEAFLPEAAFWGGAAQALPLFADCRGDGGELVRAGFLPELEGVVGVGSFAGACAAPWRRSLQAGGGLGAALRAAWVRLQQQAHVAEVDEYAGVLAAAAEAAPYTERHLQRVLTKEVEDYRQQRLQSRLDALHVHDRRRESFRAVKDGAPGAWVTAWPGAGCRLSNDQLSVWAAWYVGEGPSLLKPFLGRRLRKVGSPKVWGVVDEHGVGVTCSKVDAALKTCHDRVKFFLAAEARKARMGVVVVEVFGAFTRAFREADLRRADSFLGTRARDKHGIVPDLQLGVPFYDVKGIRSDSTHSNYNGAAVTGVAKKEERWRVEVQRRAVDLDAECFGVQPPAVGPWQRALQAAGGVRPLVFGQYGEFGSGLQTLLDELALAGAAEAAERYLLESSAAAAAVQKRLLRQRLVCCVAQAQADVLLSRLHLCLPGWRAAEGRRRRAEQQFDWQEAARARGLEWDARGSDSSDFDEPQGAHRHH